MGQDQDRKTIMQAEEKERQAAPKPTVYTDKEDTPPREDRRNRKLDPYDLKNERYSHRRDRSRSHDRSYRSHQQSRRSRSRSPRSRYQRRSRSHDRSPVVSRK